ncbi:LysR family transcriptional regulator [Roseomonas sp. AR75]|uniref:LysR family transcriptional regulator n=1 Tax=Roseomonas sp. AR75 TaxID=2562311 RepID=UPI0014858445|nr:LysR family transcriptional regulator [Roseomonas sp. AR75]
MLETRQVWRFVALAEERHFGRAAARLGIGQPQLSRAIQRLESQVGARLLSRSTRDVALTEAGRSLLDDGRRMLAIAAAAPSAARRAAQGKSGTLALGFSGSCAYAFLPAALEGFRRARPDVHLALRQMAAPQLIEALRLGHFDLCLLRAGAVPPGVAGALVFEEPLVVALPRSNPLSAQARIRPGDLAGAAFLSFPRNDGSDFHRQLLEICGAAGFAPRIVQEVSPMHALIGLVGAGVGVAIVPASVRKLRFDGVVYRPLAQAGARSQVWAIWRPDRLPAPARAFAEHIGVAMAHRHPDAQAAIPA